MRTAKPNSGLKTADVTPEDVSRLFGEVDPETFLAILDLRPTIGELEEAALRLAGNGEAVGRRQAGGTVVKILDLLEPGEEEERAPGGGPGRA
jgi:hypothetical protein